MVFHHIRESGNRFRPSIRRRLQHRWHLWRSRHTSQSRRRSPKLTINRLRSSGTRLPGTGIRGLASTRLAAVKGWRGMNRGRYWRQATTRKRRARRYHDRIHGQWRARRAVHTRPGLMCQRSVVGSARLPRITTCSSDKACRWRHGGDHWALSQPRRQREPSG